MAKRKTKKTKSRSYDAFLKEELKDSELAAEYLSLAIKEESIEGFLIAFRNVAEAHGGMATLSRVAKLNRQSMYKMFSEKGNPTFASLIAILGAIGLDLSFQPQERRAA